ncbi:MAG: Xanthine dehydrogenase iron-sulfur subunit / Xanthine dehydrogenase, FAD binding subunit, partial [uncultured Thermomicrobiales bacterium]
GAVADLPPADHPGRRAGAGGPARRAGANRRRWHGPVGRAVARPEPDRNGDRHLGAARVEVRPRRRGRDPPWSARHPQRRRRVGRLRGAGVAAGAGVLGGRGAPTANPRHRSRQSGHRVSGQRHDHAIGRLGGRCGPDQHWRRAGRAVGGVLPGVPPDRAPPGRAGARGPDPGLGAEPARVVPEARPAPRPGDLGDRRGAGRHVGRRAGVRRPNCPRCGRPDHRSGAGGGSVSRREVPRRRHPRDRRTARGRGRNPNRRPARVGRLPARRPCQPDRPWPGSDCRRTDPRRPADRAGPARHRPRRHRPCCSPVRRHRPRRRQRPPREYAGRGHQDPARRPARGRRFDRYQGRLCRRRVRCLHRLARRSGRDGLPGPRAAGRRHGRDHDRGTGRRGRAAPPPTILHPSGRRPMRLLHPRHAHGRRQAAGRTAGPRGSRRSGRPQRQSLPVHGIPEDPGRGAGRGGGAV